MYRRLLLFCWFLVTAYATIVDPYADQNSAGIVRSHPSKRGDYTRAAADPSPLRCRYIQCKRSSQLMEGDRTRNIDPYDAQITADLGRNQHWRVSTRPPIRPINPAQTPRPRLEGDRTRNIPDDFPKPGHMRGFPDLLEVARVG